MEVRIDEITSTVRAVDGDTLLSPRRSNGSSGSS
jgi:hypothetical protein